MSIYGPFTNCGIFLDGYNLTGDANMVKLDISAEIRDRSTFGQLGRVRGYGFEDVALNAAGLVSTDLDAQLRSHLWSTGIPSSLFVPATTGAAVVAGDLAFFFSAASTTYQGGGAWGNDLMFTLNLVNGGSGDKCGIGRVMNPGLVAVTADGGMTPIQVGEVTAGKYLYAILHVTEVSTDDSIVVTIESDNLVGFTDPTTRITFDSKSAIGGQYAVKVAGPFGASPTDTWWRAYHNVTGVADVSIKYACAIAIR
jgi:hypothetical protein